MLFTSRRVWLAGEPVLAGRIQTTVRLFIRYNGVMQTGKKLIPVFTTQGDVGAFLLYPYLYNLQGEWIGWVSSDRNVYSVLGYHVGILTKDPRIITPQARSEALPRREPPPQPDPIRPPASLPLAPIMADIPSNMMDVLVDAPEQLLPYGFGDLIDDMH